VRQALPWREVFHAAFQSLWAHRARSVLTALGIIIGVASVLTVVHLTRSLEGRIMADVNREGSHTFFLEPYVPFSVWQKGLKVRFQPLDPQQLRELRALVPEILLASPEVSLYGPRNEVKAGGLVRRVALRAMDENGMDLAGLELAAGRGFTPTDRATRAPVVVLGSRIAQDLDLTPARLGTTFTLGGQTAELIGILKRQGDVPFLPQGGEEAAAYGPDGQVYIPYGAFRELWTPGAEYGTSWRLQVDPRLAVADAEELLKANLRRVRGLRGDDPDNFQLATNRKQVEMVEKLGRTLLAASAAMVSVSLLVGGIGVMNIMLVSVGERTREIGLRKAVGARRWDLLVQFLVEAVVLCVAGGILGAVLGLGLGTLLSRVALKHVGTVPPWTLVAALGVPALVGLAFGLYPAHKAAKLDAIDSLRYE